MGVLVLGAGLLGAHIAQLYDVVVLGHPHIEITNPFAIDRTFQRYKPEVVINCAGIVPKAESDPLHTLRVNAQGPRLLQLACDEINAKLIHISTDCVFNGVRGEYDEIDVPNPDTLYGMSKYLGEIYEPPHLTIRTSFVGLPDARGHGLLSWAAQQEKIVGFDHHFWNGLTTVELATLLFEKVLVSQYTGLLHLYGETLSKFELLRKARDFFGWTYQLEKESETTDNPHLVNRTLSSFYPEAQTSKSFDQMLYEMTDRLENNAVRAGT